MPKRSHKHDIITMETIFKPDPYGDLEDTKPVEQRKGRRNNPDHTIPWEAIKQ